MRRPHERLALLEEKMIVVFFGRGWDNLKFFQKSAFLLNWWPIIAETVRRAKPATFWRVPAKWELEPGLTPISTADLKLEKILRQKAAQKRVSSARKAKMQPAARPSLFDALEDADAKD